MNGWTKENALWHLQASQRRYDKLKLEVISDQTDKFKKHLLDDAEKNMLHYVKIYQSI